MGVFGSRWLQRTAALTAMWLVIYTLNLQAQSWALYSIFALALVLEFLGFQHGVASGIQIYLKMTPEQRKEIEQIVKDDQ